MDMLFFSPKTGVLDTSISRNVKTHQAVPHKQPLLRVGPSFEGIHFLPTARRSTLIFEPLSYREVPRACTIQET